MSDEIDIVVEIESKTICKNCNSINLNDLGHGSTEGTVICLNCNSHYWKKWYTKEEWEIWIDDTWLNGANNGSR